MKARILFTKNSEHERTVRDFARELEKHKVELELIEADSAEGQHLSETYDLLGRPAVLLTREDGSVVQRWQTNLPLIADVSYMAHT